MSKGPFSALSEDLSSNYLPTNQKEQEQIFSQIINSNEIILNLKVSYKNKRKLLNFGNMLLYLTV